MLTFERHYVLFTPVAELVDPGRVGCQGSAHRHEVEFVTLEPANEGVDADVVRILAPVRLEKIEIQPNTSDGDGWEPGGLLCPTRKIRIRSCKLWIIESTVARVEHIDSGVREWEQETFELGRGLQEFKLVVSLLPL